MAGLVFSLVDSGEGQFGDLRYQIANVTFDSSYPTGGEALPLGTGGTPTVGGIQKVLGAMYVGAADATSAGIIPVYKPSTGKILAMRVTATGTIAAPTFTGSALTAHSHTLFVATGATDATGARVNAATNSFAMNNAAASIAGIPAASGAAGGVVDVTGGTPAGTISAPVFTGTSASLVEVSNGVSLASVTVVMWFFGI